MKNLKLIIIKLINIYGRLIVKTDKNIFALLFNLKSFLLFSPSRLSWCGKSFVITDKELPDFKYKIRSQGVCNITYEFGIKTRAKNLEDCYFLDEIDFKDNDVFIDCGANVGDLKIWTELQNKKIEYIAFEPSPIEFDCLKENVYPSQAYNIGLWNKKRELAFYISSNHADSSIIKPKNFDDKITVKVSTLEEYVSKPVKCLKLEAEGAEPEVLEGLESKLSLVEYIAADLGYERGVDCESTLPAVTNFLCQRGFELIKINHTRICALYKNRNPDFS